MLIYVTDLEWETLWHKVYQGKIWYIYIFTLSIVYCVAILVLIVIKVSKLWCMAREKYLFQTKSIDVFPILLEKKKACSGTFLVSTMGFLWGLEDMFSYPQQINK